MKKTIIFVLQICVFSAINGQITTIAPGNFIIVDIGISPYGSYSRAVILLHEIFDGQLITKNYAIGMIYALRGAAGSNNRTNVAEINTSSGYNSIHGSLKCTNSDDKWTLKTVTYNGKKYMAVHVPIRNDNHTLGIHFMGRSYSTGERMKLIVYKYNDQVLNSEVESSMVDFTPNMSEYHDVNKLIINGKVGIGTSSPNVSLAVNGHIKATEVNVLTNVNSVPDFVFNDDYELRSLQDIKEFIKANNHLPDIPSAPDLSQEGINLGDMNMLLLRKIEELTLHLIFLYEAIEDQKKEIEVLKMNNSRL